jgi:hypothetical protein
MAREAGADTLMYWDIEKLKRFEALVRADERALAAPVEPVDDIEQMISDAKAMAEKEQLRFVGELADGKWKRWDGEPVAVKYFGQLWALTKPTVQPAPVQEPVACNTGVPPLYPEMKDGETISVEYYILPAQPAPVQEPVQVWQAEGYDALMKEMQMVKARNIRQYAEIERLSALVRAQQITIDKLEQALAAPVQEEDLYDLAVKADNGGQP